MYNYNYGCGCGNKVPTAVRANGSQMYNTTNSQMGMQGTSSQGATNQSTTVNLDGNQAPIVATSMDYTQGYLRSKIGKRVRVEFLLGSSMLVDRGGTLVDVGVSYIVIRETATNNLIMCDMYSIKFVTFYD